MKLIIIVALALIIYACAGGNYTADHSGKGFNPRNCLNVPIGIESF
ncbi:hypothetical protein MYX76_13290 [Desulfobacterota bacterium AH_259_B03_O07]|nr:hypothetical protein [Desulfobacterota bacterium AH_259_B03_O07]